MAIKKWEELEITDDFLFGKVMRNPEICKRTVEAILDIQIDHIEYPEEQKVIDISVDAKSVRLDVYVKDSKDTIYNIEMQPTNRGILPKRSRYYQSMIDLNLIEKGQAYKKLNPSYIIFICAFDLFGKNRCIYTFENRCIQETDLPLGDETTKIFLNSKGDKTNVNANLAAFLDYINRKETTNNDFIEALDHEVKEARQNKKWRLEYMTLYTKLQETLEDGKKAGYAIGMAEGIAEGRAEGIAEGRAEGIAEGRAEGIAEGRAEGIAEGRAEGIAQGIVEGNLSRLISQVRKKAEKGLSAEDAADMLEEKLELITSIMDILKACPELDNEGIYQKLI